MFENPGGKMKTTAYILFWLGLVGTVILAFVFGKDKYGDIEFFSFTIIAVIGAVSSYFSSLVLYGIGDAIEDIARTRSVVSLIYEKEKRQQAKTDDNTPFKAPTPTVRTNTDSFDIDEDDYL